MDADLQKLLKSVSRSFYLSLAVLPEPMRTSLGISFLLCKIADTIADTELISTEERLPSLWQYRETFLSRSRHPTIKMGQEGGTSAEKELLRSTARILSAMEELPNADQQHIRWLVPELIQGMILDLTLFQHGGKRIVVLPNEALLERYTYHVAGCVGRFWTRLTRTHYAFAAGWGDEVEDLGERLGKGLQMVNIIRDLPRDLQQGRCYLPDSMLSARGISAEDLAHGHVTGKEKQLLKELTSNTRKQLQAGFRYLHYFPRTAVRLRMPIILPISLGIKTLDLIEHSPHEWLNPNNVLKIPRTQVYQSLASAFLFSWVN
ncbi:MAG: squalene/phytoene synthase family protein [Deltaproteobacteria bacterium]|nr:squalene/phytoene synthase family protein [Deltaproteobacteria bacterium]